MECILKTENISKRYGRFQALGGLNMNVPKGSIYGLVGRNGAGKTTLIRVVCGLNAPTSGEYSIFGVKHSDSEILKVRRKMGAIVETPSIHPEMTARDNLIQQYKALGMPSDGMENVLKMVGLSNTGKKKAKNFSLGMRQRLGIAVALIGDPEFLILDEPINGLDPQGIIEMRETLISLNRDRNITILISSHILDELSRLATHYGFMDRGHIVKEMSAEDLEKACRSSLHVVVNDTQLLAQTLDEMKLEYRLFSPTEADIFTPIKVTPLVLALNDKGCEVISMNERHESLENYFIGLVGGASYNG